MIPMYMSIARSTIARLNGPHIGRNQHNSKVNQPFRNDPFGIVGLLVWNDE